MVLVSLLVYYIDNQEFGVGWGKKKFKVLSGDIVFFVRSLAGWQDGHWGLPEHLGRVQQGFINREYYLS